MKNLREMFRLPKWAKIALVALSAVVIVLLISAFVLQKWADSQVESANLVLTKIDKNKSAELSGESNILGESQIYAYEARVYFKRLDFLLRSRTISNINLQSIAWNPSVDSRAIQSIETHNRRLNFTTTQNLALDSLDSGASLGIMSFKMDFSALKNELIKYICAIYALIFFMIFALNYIFFRFKTHSFLEILQCINANNISQANLAKIQGICIKIAFAFITFVVALFVLSTFGFIAKIPINAFYFYIAFAIALISLLYKNPRKILSIIIFLGIFALSAIVAINFYDYSWDGRAYHQIGIFYLANGYNPVYEKMSVVTNLSQFLSHEIWVEHYMKFAEIAQSCIYKAFGLIEGGKMINYLFAFGALFYAIATLSKLKHINIAMAILLGFLAVFSPVVVGQISTYYIDGLLGCALIYVFLAILNIENKHLDSRKIHYIIFVIALLATASIKFTGLAYAGFIGIAYFIYKIFCRNFSKSKRIFICGIIVSMLIFICNANPLLTNLAQGKHIGYPLMGAGKVDIITGNAPINFAELNRFEKLALSLFSKTQNLLASSSKDSTQLKIPFIKNSGEDDMGGTDTRVAGFGYFFGGIIILCALMILMRPRAFNDKKFVLWFALIFGSCVINPEMWWARYVPQMWLIPFIFVIFSYSFAPKIFSSKLRLGVLGFLILSVIFCILHTNLLRYTRDIKAQLANLDKNEILLYFPYGFEKSFGIKLLERGISPQILSKDELDSHKANGTKFYRLNNALDNYDDKVALWNVAPKEQ